MSASIFSADYGISPTNWEVVSHALVGNIQTSSIELKLMHGVLGYVYFYSTCFHLNISGAVSRRVSARVFVCAWMRIYLHIHTSTEYA